MIFKEVSYEAQCPDCRRGTMASSYGKSIPLDQIHTKIILSECQSCKKQQVISHLKCVLSEDQVIKVLDMQLKCLVCNTSWGITRIYGKHQMPLSGFAKSIRERTMCISPWCDHMGVQIMKVKNIS